MNQTPLLALSEGDLALATDLYQLTMARVYCEEDPRPRATFELFVRGLPAGRGFLVFAGLEQALGALVGLRFSEAQVAYLRGLPQFATAPESFFEELLGFRFRAEVWALPEGTVFFAQEPVLRVTGDLLEAQVVETLLLTILNFQSAIASKAARVRLAAGERSLAEFGGRRAHGPQAAAWVARAAYLAGFDATANLLAGRELGIPVTGTMAHSFVLSFASEEEAFCAYQEAYPEHTILLVDTFDTLRGVEKAVATGRPFQAVRLDSGNLASLAVEAREILDRGGRPDALVFASGDLDEHAVKRLLAAGAPIDAFGVGTRLATSADAPYLGGVYKLVEVEREGRRLPRFKASPGKETYPGRKQVLRQYSGDRMAGERMTGDRIVPEESAGSGDGVPLLRPVMRDGRLLEPEEGLETARERCREQLAALPEPLRRLDAGQGDYPVEVDESLLRAVRGE